MAEISLILLTALGRVVVACAVVWVVVRVLKAWLPRLTRRTRTNADDMVVGMTLGTAAPLGYLAAVLWGWQSLHKARADKLLPMGDWADRVVQGAVMLLGIVLVVRLINRLLIWLLERSLHKLGRENQVATLRALTPMIRVLIWILGILVFLQNQGVGLGAVYASLAGAGIGIGLALKGPLANFFNYLTILFDQPFEIGQVIRFDDVVAFVDRVGMRSSRLRSVDGEMIVISNEELLNRTIRNYGDLPRRRLISRFGVIYQTPVEKVAAIPAMVAETIDSAPPLELDRCHFIAFGDSSLDFEISFFVPSGDLKQALDLQQEFNLGIMRRFAREGIEFAYPTRTIHLQSEGEQRGAQERHQESVERAIAS
jgi:small-conductance mechanosensitive channel